MPKGYSKKSPLSQSAQSRVGLGGSFFKAELFKRPLDTENRQSRVSYAARDRPQTRGEAGPQPHLPSCTALLGRRRQVLRRVDRPGGSAILTQLSPHSHLPYLWLHRGNLGKPAALTQVIPVHSPHGCLSSLQVHSRSPI